MSYLFRMKAALLRIALLGLLAGCSTKDGPTPTPTGPDDVISLQVTAENVTGLGAELQVVVGVGEDGKPAYVDPSLNKFESYSGTVITTIPIATVPRYREGVKRYEFNADITFRNVRSSNSTRGGANTRFRVEWLVNGQAVTSSSRPSFAELTAASVPTSASAPMSMAYLATNSL
jgi:hypothetical protein